MINLRGKIAVITGAGSGIGAATAELFYQLNASLVLLGKSEDKLRKLARSLDKNDKRVSYYKCDVRDERELSETCKKILHKRQKIDILVNSVGAPPISKKTENLSFTEWREVLSTDLDGVFLSCKIFGKAMIQNRHGRIVNLTSFHTVATYPKRAAYNAAKSGVEGLTRALAVEWGKYGITVNAVAPGPIMTPRTSWFLTQDKEAAKGMLGRTPSVRIGEPQDVAAVIAFLVSEEARHINGQQIVIDGGWTKSAWWGKYG